MAYADKAFYMNEYKGTAIPEPELDSALEKASRAVDQATRYRIRELTDWPEFTQRQVKLACCSFADHSYKDSEINDLLDVIGSYSIGDVSVSAKSGADSATDLMAEHYGLTAEAMGLLMPTGLLDRRV